jgi:SAM-dependent methyltransferase
MYNSFAYIYDKVMSGVNYENWAEYYQDIFSRFQTSPEIILDLGCGTGSLTSRMADRGYDMIGVDSSADMLSVALEKRSGILYLNMDMTDFELYGTVGAVISSLDCLNYILNKRDLKKIFKLVNNYLDPGGIFIFDINSHYKLSKLYGNNVFINEENNIFYCWENSFDGKITAFNINFFEKGEDKTYQRFIETQYQRAYTVDEIKTAAVQAGLKVRGIFDEFTFEKPHQRSERIFFVLGGKEKIK